MSRSVVLRDSPRCIRCHLTPRWCICAGHREIDSVLQVDVMMHFMECYRPSSTGHLIRRVMPGSRQHVYRKERLLEREVVVLPDRELWILHPQGEPLPTGADPTRLQVLLLDASWVQATEMAHRVSKWGRRV
ncbi:MAG: DTW domain-containing protein, partial [Candidatus Didemnitutus sp.]|nr:DTW domain-containing protein [Candidatus Didemnitutus sp.]